jgi:HK97 family phage portal protein
MKNKPGLVFFDGAKAISAWDFDSVVGWTSLNGDTRMTVDPLYYNRVPWLHRAVKDRANNVGSMPFHIDKGEAEVDSSQDYQNKLEFMPNPVKLFKLLEMSLAMAGRAYVFLETNRGGYIKNVKYLNPATITEIYDENGNLKHYERRINGKKFDILPINIAAFYDTEYTAEIGPGQGSDALAALSAAGVLFNADKFIASYFERGAIKATILSADTMNQQESERLQSWWNDVITGIKNAWAAVVIKAKTVTATVIGEGLEALENKELTTERRQDIATAMGVPESKMWSSAANRATSEQDEKNYLLGTIIPECDILAEGFNTQVFTVEHKLDGYKLWFDAESLDAFQEDIKLQAEAAQRLVAMGYPLLMASDLVGIELSDDQRAELEKLQAEAEAMAEEIAQTEDEPPAQEEQDEPPQASQNEMRSVLSAWKRKALHACKRGDAQPAFETTVLPAKLADYIRTSLTTCTDEAGIKAVFEGIILTDEPPVVEKVDPLDRAQKLVERLEAALATK